MNSKHWQGLHEIAFCGQGFVSNEKNCNIFEVTVFSIERRIYLINGL